jgi:predicted small secreted protein
MTLVIFEVAIAFLVEAFVYKVLARQRHRICRKHKKPFKQCKCVEGELFVIKDSSIPLETVCLVAEL